MNEAAPIQEHGTLIRCAAVAAVFLADDVTPAVKSVALSIFNTAASSGHELLDYGISGTYEVKKIFYAFIPPISQEIWEFPQGIPLAILNELGSYLENGVYESGKYVFSVLDEIKKGVEALFELFFQHVFQELSSYASYGFDQVVQVIPFSCRVVIEAGVTPCLLLYTVGQEFSSYTAFGIHEIAKATGITMKTAREGLFELYQVGQEVAEEVQFYAKSGVSEMAKAVIIVGGGAISNLVSLARFSSMRSVLEELVSYCESGAHQIVKSGEFAKNNADEATYELREGAYSAATECASFAISGFGESGKGLIFGLQAVDAGTLYPRELIGNVSGEVLSYGIEGVAETGQGIMLGIRELDEGTEIPREMLRDSLLEIASYTILGVNESAKGIFVTGHFLEEGIQYPAEIIVEGIKELISYTISGHSELSKSGELVLSALSESWQLPEEPILHMIGETISYLKSGQYELAHAKQLITVDVADACYQEIVAPIEKKFTALVELGRRIRAERRIQ